jgi:hypothetical protein
MRHMKPARIFIFALFGACFATLGDAFHVRTHTLSYPDPVLFGQAWWVFPGFLLVFLSMGYLYVLAIGRLFIGMQARQSASRGSAHEMIEAASVFIFVYFLSGYGNYDPVMMSVIFYCAFAVRWLLSYDRAWLLLFAAAMAVGGMLAEGAMAAAGLVAYRHADVFNVPLWLGGLYLHGAFALREGMRYFYYGSRGAD